MPYKDPAAKKLHGIGYRKRLSLELKAHRDSEKDIRRQMLSEAKAKPCADCRLSFPKEMMQLDHVRGVKILDVSRMVQIKAPIDRLKSEILKCDVVCIGCHRMRTELRQNFGSMSCSQHDFFHAFCRKCVRQRRFFSWRQERRSIIASRKSCPCSKCGQTFHPCQMDFDHIGPKTMSIADLNSRQASLDRLIKELAHCVVLCCWCHTAKTFGLDWSHDKN